MERHHPQTSAMLDKKPRQKYWESDQIQFVGQIRFNKLAIKELVFLRTAGVSLTILINLVHTNWESAGSLPSQEAHEDDQFLVLQLN